MGEDESGSGHEKESQLSVEAGGGLGTKNYIVVREGASAEDIINMAAQNEAMVSGEGEEAGDDLYAVQFPGRESELMSEDDIAGALREMSGERDE
jgi:hypothetical protein